MTIASASREQIVSSSRVRLGAVSFALSGILFVLYPLLRPFSDESSLRVLKRSLLVSGFWHTCWEFWASS